MREATRDFTEHDQTWFARVSGDYSPLHVDPTFASRRYPGFRVVHGAHALMWAIDATSVGTASIDAIAVTFVKPILLGDTVTARAEDENSVRLFVCGELVATVRFAARGPCREAAGTELAAITLPGDSKDIARQFSRLASRIGEQRVRGIAAVSTLVGMRCPGTDGMLSSFSLKAVDSNDDGLRYRVDERNAALSRVEMGVSGLGWVGEVVAFETRPVVSPLADATILGLVRPGEFTGAQPLIVGGSSGLGLATARLMAAGGATPTITWSGVGDGEACINAALKPFGAEFSVAPLDVRKLSHREIADLPWNGDSIYYFASPRIFRRRLEPYQGADLRDFTAFYVDGFYELIRAVMTAAPNRTLKAFYPSSVAITERNLDMFEYCAAKMVGEELCATLSRRYKTLQIRVERLPRSATGQTASLIRTPAEAPERLMLPILRAIRDTLSAAQ